jgi:DNA-binding NtrC family response regulator
MEKKRVLIVDDELNIRRILQAAFDKNGWYAAAAENGQAALALLEEGSYDCVLTDVTMPGMSGMDLQSEVNSLYPETPVVMMTAYGSIPQAVQAVRSGAYEYIPKPFDLDALKKTLGAAMSQKNGKKSGKASAKKGNAASQFIAESPAMQEVVQTIQQVADSRATVLMTGESGTGKEIASKLLHDLSPRNDHNFVAVSCAALPETLLESELFGHEKGAFTGADNARIGRFEAADGGTLLLDEIGEIPLPVQIKLLRVLQERQFERLGSTSPVQVDARLIAATNRDLQSAVDDGSFRLDLLYRLQVVEIALPPLRDRQEDIEPLCVHFLNKHAPENGRSMSEVSMAALSRMCSYNWPGNVRELENVVERAVVLSPHDETVLQESCLPPKMRSAA